MLALLNQHYAAEMVLCSIPGIRHKTAGMLPLFAGSFTSLTNYRQLIAKTDLSPREHSSDTSVRDRVRIPKMVSPLIRSKLYMCSVSAKRINAACKALYDRLLTKSKARKLALIAVCNNLLKQALAIVKSGIPIRFVSTRGPVLAGAL